MSYIHMDHAGWVQQEITASKSRRPNARERKAMAGRKGWHAAPDTLNAFQRRAFDILGMVGGGIYNAPISWDTVWWSSRGIGVSWYGTLATFDFTQLTRLVLLCHEARIRAHIGAHGPRHIEIHLSERKAEGLISERHPNLDEAIAAFRAEIGPDHPIKYREVTEAVPEHTGPRLTEAEVLTRYAELAGRRT